MGSCLTTLDFSSGSDSSPDVHLSSVIRHNNNLSRTQLGAAHRDLYCSNWLKFPICCRYCSNHSEPSQEFQLVILGPGYTGKTTLRHHLVQRYGHAFCKADFLMYRDILQHNVLDLFRDLLQKPSLTFSELKQFVQHLDKEADSEVSAEESELDAGLHDLTDDDLDAYDSRCKQYLTPKSCVQLKDAIHSNSASLQSMESSSACSMDALSVKITTYNDDNYCSVNQCSPSSPVSTPPVIRPAKRYKAKWRSSLSTLIDSLTQDKEPHEQDIQDEEEEQVIEAAAEEEEEEAVADNDEEEQEDEEQEEEEPECCSIEYDGVDCMSDLIDKLKCEDLKYGRDNGQYLINNSARILSDSFEPSFIDLLQCHVRSTGLMFENHVVCRSLPVDAWPASDAKRDIVFRVVDVGGHRNERKKWNYVLRQRNDVIVFVVSAASFCQVLFEDFKKNAMRESISVWQDILSKNASSDTQFILVINKIDLFYERCHLFRDYFAEYTGDVQNKFQVLEYIKSLYLDIAKQHSMHNVHCVCTKLTDCLEMESFDVEQMKHILMSHSSDMQQDIVDTIVSYAVGDVFWSQDWIKPMWQRRMQQLHHHDQQHHNHNDNGAFCDHINHPHDYRKVSRTSASTGSSSSTRTPNAGGSSKKNSLATRLSAIFPSTLQI